MWHYHLGHPIYASLRDMMVFHKLTLLSWCLQGLNDGKHYRDYFPKEKSRYVSISLYWFIVTFEAPWPPLLLGDPSSSQPLLMVVLNFSRSTLLNRRMRCLENFKNSSLLYKVNATIGTSVFGLLGQKSKLVMISNNFSTLRAFLGGYCSLYSSEKCWVYV